MFSADALRVIKAATDLNADPGKALFWFRNEPLSAFGGKTAEQLVSEGGRMSWFAIWRPSR